MRTIVVRACTPTTSLPAQSQQRRCSGFAVDLRSPCESQKQLRRSTPSKHYTLHSRIEAIGNFRVQLRRREENNNNNYDENKSNSC